MLTLTVERHNGQPPAVPLAAQFDAAGGTIGRAETNRLVLADAERTVSRVHAQIVAREGCYGLIDRGSNPALVNGRPLEPGEEVPLHDGDEVQIGGYQLSTRIDAPHDARARARGDVRKNRPVGDSRSAASVSADPFADIFGTGPAAEDSAFDSLLRPATAPARAETLPADFDLDLGFGGPGFTDPATHRSIDELFDLGPGSDARAPDASRRDTSGTFVNQPFEEPLSAPNTAHSADPFASLAGIADAPRAPRADLGSELHSALPMRRKPAVAVECSEPGEVSDTAPSGDAALVRALAEGLGMEPDALALTPALMRRIGGLLRESTQGTLDLLAARAATKREMRADATLIAAEENNPLKFSPNVDTALAHLLRAPARGFMPAEAALADAYDDLRAHQVGFVAGMRAALDGVFERFEPARIEKRLTQHSLLDTLLPQLNRRARCWDLFTERYGQLASEAEDDFHTLFGRAFLAAYEAQIDRLKRRA